MTDRMPGQRVMQTEAVDAQRECQRVQPDDSCPFHEVVFAPAACLKQPVILNQTYRNLTCNYAVPATDRLPSVTVYHPTVCVNSILRLKLRFSFEGESIARS